MNGRSILYLILWVVLAFLLFRSCKPESTPPGEAPVGFRAETFDSADSPEEQTASLETEFLAIDWSLRGAGATSIKLKDYTSTVMNGSEASAEDWLEVYRSVPALPPPTGAEPGIDNHRRRDALRFWEPEGRLGIDLDAADWVLEPRASNSDALAFTLETESVTLTKTIRPVPGERHLVVELTAVSRVDGALAHDLRFEMGTGGGMVRVEDNFYPNPYVAAARWEHQRLGDIEKFVPTGGRAARRDAAVRWNGEFMFVLEGSKYFLSSLRPIGGQPFQQVVAELLYDHDAYTAVMQKGLTPEQFEQMAAVANANVTSFQTNGRPATPDDLAKAAGVTADEAVAILADYQARNREAAQVLDKPWLRSSISGGFTVRVAAAGTEPEVRRFQWYVGPKDPSYIGTPAYEPLDSVMSEIDYGGSFFYNMFFTKLIAPTILWIIKMFHSLVGNWGVAIILMTVLVRGALFPLNRRGQVKMAVYQQKMAKVKPILDGIKEKYADNPQKKNEETMKVYKENKLSPPLGGCLPILLQFPVFIGLFAALRCSILLRQEPFFGWITDLSRPDAFLDFGGPVMDFWPLSGVTTFNILPILMVILWVLHQRSMPKPADPQQAQVQKMMTFMPVLFGLLLYNYAAGLSLYMITSSSIGIFESRVIKKKWPVTPGGTPNAATGKA